MSETTTCQCGCAAPDDELPVAETSPGACQCGTTEQATEQEEKPPAGCGCGCGDGQPM